MLDKGATLNLLIPEFVKQILLYSSVQIFLKCFLNNLCISESLKIAWLIYLTKVISTLKILYCLHFV